MNAMTLRGYTGRIEDAVQAEPLGEVMLKGIAQPVPVFNLIAFKS